MQHGGSMGQIALDISTAYFTFVLNVKLPRKYSYPESIQISQGNKYRGAEQ